MPPRQKSSPNTRVAALIPVNSEGDQVGEAQNWGLQVDQQQDQSEVVVTMPRDEPVEQTATDRVMAMLHDAGTDATAKVQIYRVAIAASGAKQKLVFVDEMPPEDFERGSLKMMATAYGGGDYELRLYGATGDNGAFGLRSRVRVSVEAPPRSMSPSAPSDLSAVLNHMQESNAAIMRALTEKPAVDPMAQMTQMLTMMKLMREATGDSGTAKGPGNDLTATLALVRELKGATELFEPAQPDGSPFGMVKEMLPMITAAMASKPAAPVSVPASIAAPPVALPHSSHDPLANIMELPMFTLGQKIKLRGTLATLLELAKANVEHEEGAALVLDALPDEMLEILANDEWWETFAQIVPSAVPFKAWFLAVRDMAIAEWENDDDDSTPNLTSGTDAVDAIEPAPAAPAAAPAAKLKRAAAAKTTGPAAAPGNDDAAGT